jgi:SRSO17 transposase
LDEAGWWFVLEVPTTTPVFSASARAAVPSWSGRGPKPTRVRLLAGERGPEPVTAVAAAWPAAAWQTLSVAEGAQGPRRYAFAARRVWESREQVPGRECWLLVRRSLDRSDVSYYVANAPADTPWQTLAEVGASRGPIETEFEQSKGEVGLDEYEVRGWRGWQHHITVALLANAFLLELQQAWGGKGAAADAAAGGAHPARDPAALALEPRRSHPVA